MRRNLSRQSGLFDDEKPEPHGLEWLQTCWIGLETGSDNDDGYWFACNLWTLLRTTEHWSRLQESQIDAALWVLAAARSYDNFLALALGTSTTFEWNIDAFLDDTFGLTEAEIVKHFFGYTGGDIESFGFPSFEDVGWYDRLIEADKTVRGQMAHLLRGRIGSRELILNFYRDPLGWDKRLQGQALPPACEQRPLPLNLDQEQLGELLEAAFELFDVFV